MVAVLLAASLLASEPDATQLPLLKTFRSEFIDLTPGKGMHPATFTMGTDDGTESEAPAHRVRMLEPYSIARYEVPQNLWEAVMGTNPSRWKGPRNSVEMLSFDEANAFCRKVTELMRAAKLITATQVVRLPSEAEWEYAARAGTTTRYSFGDNEEELRAYGWYHGNAAGNDPPVGAKKPNPWNLYDVHGYLWEWCSDVWHANYINAPADSPPWMRGGDPAQRVLRGGSWKDPAERLTSASRRGAAKTLRDDAVGLRCVLATTSKVAEKPKPE